MPAADRAATADVDRDALGPASYKIERIDLKSFKEIYLQPDDAKRYESLPVTHSGCWPAVI